MPPSLITTLILLGIFVLFKIFEKRQASQANEIIKRAADVYSPSYSLLIILLKPTTEIKAVLEDLYKRSGYYIDQVTSKTDSFTNWNDKIYFDTKKLRKGIIYLKDSVVLNDPETVLFTNLEIGKQLSKELNCKILMGIWERISWTVMMDIYEEGNLISSTSVTDGKADSDTINPDNDLLKKPDGDNLKVVLWKHGLNTDELFNKADLQIIEYSMRSTE